MSTSSIPAAPTSRNPVLRRAPSAGLQLARRVPTSELRIMFVGLNPVSAAAAIMVAGCGVNGFVIIDPRPTTWDDASAGAFDVPDVGLARELTVRQRIRAANPGAAPLADPRAFPSEPEPGTIVVRTRDLRYDEVEDPRLQAVTRSLSETHRMIDVVTPGGHCPGTTVLWPARPWYARACEPCLARAAGPSIPERSRATRHEIWPTHTAFAAAILAQLIVGAAGQPWEPAHGRDTSPGVDVGAGLVTVIRPDVPLSRVEQAPDEQARCALCAASWPPTP